MQASSASTPTSHLLRAVAGGVLLAALGACGYKGPLYMPPPPPPAASLTAPPTPQALPSDASTAAPPATPDTSTAPAVK